MKKYVILLIIIMIYFLDGLFNPTMTKVVVENNKLLEGNFEVSSDKFIIENNYVKSVPIKTKKEDFLNFFKSNEATLGFSCDNGTNYIGSGCLLKIVPDLHSNLDYKIVVPGDVNGDGINSITDAVKMVTYISDNSSFSDESYVLASDLDNSKSVTNEDVTSFAQHTVRNMTIPVIDDFSDLTSIEVSTKSLVIEKGKTKQIEYTTKQEGLSIIQWKSSNTDVVEVDETGVVTAVDGGNATITATTNNGDNINIRIQVTVLVEPTGITFSITDDNISMDKGNEMNVIATVSPVDATNKNVTWNSSDSSIVSVDSKGNLKALKAGVATITATTINGISSSFKVTVVIPVSQVNLNNSTLSMKIGDSNTLVATVSPTDATNKNITWNSSDSSIASVDSSGNIQALKVGQATITATSSNNKTATCVVTVKSTLSLSKSSVTILDEHSSNIDVIITGATIDDINWTTKNGNVTVSKVSSNKIKVTGKSVGNDVVTGTLKTDSSIIANLSVTVNQINVLMIGNSKTYSSTLSNKIKNISAADGFDLNTVWFTKVDGVNGKGLSYIYENNFLNMSKVKDIKFDYVILQEKSATLLEYDNYYTGVVNIIKEMHSRNSNTKFYLRKSWLRDGNTDAEITTAFNNGDAVVANLKSKYNLLSIEDGPALYYAYNTTGIDVFEDDSELHQNTLGAYLIANCVYATVFNRNPVNNTYTYGSEYTGETAAKIKNIAEKYCYNN